MTMTYEDNAIPELMEAIGNLARVKRHRLAAYQVNGSKVLTRISAEKILDHLERCEDLPREERDTPVTAIERAVFERAVSRRPEPLADRTPAAPVLPPLRAFTEIPKGFYAVPSRSGNNDLDFYKAIKGKKGTQWEDCTFVVRLAGGAGEMQVFDLDNIQQRIALLAIREAGVEEAKKAYADAVGECSDCGSPLTDEVSRRYGKGPTCRNKKSD